MPVGKRALSLQVELWEAVASTFFAASVSALFGPAFLDVHGAERLQAAFYDFEDIELAASPVPHWLQPRFCAARKHLLDAFRCA